MKMVRIALIIIKELIALALVLSGAIALGLWIINLIFIR